VTNKDHRLSCFRKVLYAFRREGNNADGNPRTCWETDGEWCLRYVTWKLWSESFCDPIWQNTKYGLLLTDEAVVEKIER
jgi:hypothetical protein